MFMSKIFGVWGPCDDIGWQTHDSAGRDPDGGVLSSVEGRQP